MKRSGARVLGNQRGIVLMVALGIMLALAGLSLAVATSGRMSTVTGALSLNAMGAFHTADGAAHYALGDTANFVPDMAPRTVSFVGEPTNLDGAVTSTYIDRRTLPGNLLIRTQDGAVRAAQFGQNEGLGKMYRFRLDAKKNSLGDGLQTWSRVHLEAAVPGPCPDCGS